MNASDTFWNGSIIGLPSTGFEWFVRILALIFSIQFCWLAFARQRPSEVADSEYKRYGSLGRRAWRIVQFLLAVSLFLVAIGVLK
ncbi:MAG TPA: hypothetical protein VFP71_05585 [Candidatus Angelobacter sp.]|nr:hypothetical protein [Candidatus Angelobacter sp.]